MTELDKIFDRNTFADERAYSEGLREDLKQQIKDLLLEKLKTRLSKREFKEWIEAL